MTLELEFDEVLAHLDSTQLQEVFGSRLQSYFAVIQKDIFEVSGILANESETGVVKWFDDHKGYGFIRGRDSMDVFVHQKQIATNGYRTLKAGQKVQFKRRVGQEKLEAIEVQPIES